VKRALRTKSVGTKVSEAELRVLESRAAAAGSFRSVGFFDERDVRGSPALAPFDLALDMAGARPCAAGWRSYSLEIPERVVRKSHAPGSSRLTFGFC
jgi:hypothetical protein